MLDELIKCFRHVNTDNQNQIIYFCLIQQGPKSIMNECDMTPDQTTERQLWTKFVCLQPIHQHAANAWLRIRRISAMI
jgi:hypothetical protein